MVSIEEFQKFEFIIAKIKDARDHPNADRLYVIKVDTGNGERQLVAGIRPSYAPGDLIGKNVVIVSNLQPATIRGEESQGMILAACDENGMSVLVPDKEVALGSRVK
jgi:methionyl-tRNA synthetase